MYFKRDKTRMKKGFTLIELLISIAIFTIFLGVVTSSYVTIVRGQKDANEVRRMYAEVRDFADFFSQEVRLSTVEYGCYQNTGLTTLCSGGKDIETSVEDVYSSQCKGVFSLANGRTTDLSLVRKDGLTKTIFHYDESKKKLQVLQYVKLAGGAWQNSPEFPDEEYKDLLGTGVSVEKLQFAINPDINPYDSDYYCRNQKQFQPKVSIFMRIKNAANANSQFNLDYQTTISSRVYSKL
jgi:prepilin-type N-terminal cleavage/methylation domain-containing protein